MKKISILMAALFCLAACDKQEIVPFDPSDDGQEDRYEIVLNTLVTKSGIENVSLKMGEDEEYTLVATLLKNKQPVSGATFSWNDPETGGYYSGYTQNNTAKHDITALREGSGSTLNVTGYDENGVARATSQDIAVSVAAADPGPGPISEPYAVRYEGKIEVTSYLDISHCAPGAGEKMYSTMSSNVRDWVEAPVNSDDTDTKLYIEVTGTVYMSDGTSFAVTKSRGVNETNTGDDSPAFNIWCTSGDTITITLGTPGHDVFTWTVKTHRW